MVGYVTNGGDAAAAAEGAGWRGPWLKRGARESLESAAVQREVVRYRDFLLLARQRPAASPEVCASARAAELALPPAVPAPGGVAAAAHVPEEPEEYSLPWVLLRLKLIAERAEKDADQIKALSEIARVKQLSKQSEREIDMKDNSLQITIKGLGGRARGGLGSGMKVVEDEKED